MKQPQKITIVTPHMYSAWPMIGLSKDQLVCIYTVADQHVSTVSKLYMKTSSDGIHWTDGVEIFTDKTGVKGVTGVGYDRDGNMLVWYRNGSPGRATSTFELFKIEGDGVTLVSAPDIDIRGGHIGNIVHTPNNEMLAFYNTYGNERSWGIVKSSDNGLSWQQIPVEENVPKAECPAELECAFIKDNKILVLGRKDVVDGTIAMFQMQSSDYGKSWTKKYTNVTDSYSASPSVIFSRETDEICLYYFERKSGNLKQRLTHFDDVWDHPQSWSDAKVLAHETASGYDTGNVKTVLYQGRHICTYYAGSPTTTGVFGIISDVK